MKAIRSNAFQIKDDADFVVYLLDCRQDKQRLEGDNMSANNHGVPLCEADKRRIEEFLEQNKDSIDQRFTEFREDMCKSIEVEKNTGDR